MYNTLDYIQSDVNNIKDNTEIIRKGTEEISKGIGWLESDLNELYNISEKLDFIKIELALIIILLILIFVFNNKSYFINLKTKLNLKKE